MRSGGNDFNHFKPTKLPNFVQFKRMFTFCLEDWGLGPLPPSPLLRHWRDQGLYVAVKAKRWDAFFCLFLFSMITGFQIFKLYYFSHYFPMSLGSFVNFRADPGRFRQNKRIFSKQERRTVTISA